MKKKFVSVLLCLVLCLGMLPGTALADSGETLYLGPLYEFKVDSTYSMSTGEVEIKSTNEVAWFDRLDFGDETWQRDFYNALAEAADGDGEADFLIEDSYYEAEGNAYIYQRYSNGHTMAFNAIVAHTVTTDQQLSYTESQYYYNCIQAVCNAFNRDYPEVFWMSDYTNVQTAYSYSREGYKYTFYYVLKAHEGFADPYDARAEEYQDETTIRNSIAALNSAVTAIGTGGASNRYELLSHFNNWLTQHNQYNTSSSYPAFTRRSLTALTGNAGVNGPVCEGYARAFKVLCDRHGIPCVLVDGYAGEAHMWNYVQMEDGKWYAVDVTWNDPVTYYDVEGEPLSGYERTTYFLIGSNTKIGYIPFGSSRIVLNQVTYGGVSFTNGPVLSEEAYVYTVQTALTVTTESQSVSKGEAIDQSKYTAIGLQSGHTVVLAPSGSEIIVKDVLDATGTAVTSQYSISYISKGTYHEFDTAYLCDGTRHWHPCLVSGCSATAGDQACSGGIATCTVKAICAVCGNAYGEVNVANHTGTAEWTKTAGSHSQAYSCCGTVVVEPAAHVYTDDSDTSCDLCGYLREIGANNPVLTTELVLSNHQMVISLTPAEECTNVRYAFWANNDRDYTLRWENASFNGTAWVANVPQCALPVAGEYTLHVYDFQGDNAVLVMESAFVVDEANLMAHTYSTATDHSCDVCETIRTVPMFRMYDELGGEHFYTGSEEERDILVKEGWKYEGVAFNFPAAGAPVYRLYNPVSGDHLYTMDQAEIDLLTAGDWNVEGVAFNSAADTEVAQYRLWNPNATRGAWHFTGSEEERDFLISLGWQYQGIGWYSSLR